MGLKGTIRSLEAASRRAERESRRRQRELEQQQKQLERMTELERAQHAADVFENRISVITSVHVECGNRMDWQQLASMPAPGEPQLLSEYEDGARASAEQYTPSLADKLRRQVERKRAELSAGIERAKERDKAVHADRMREYRQELHNWETNQRIAEGVIEGQADAYQEAIRQLSPLEELGELGSSLTHKIDTGAALIDVTFTVTGESVIPRQTKSILKTGKLSVKDMPKAQFWSLYQDYVCGAALRVARELFALLPLEMVIVTALDSVLNTQTGYMEEQPILSVAIPRATIEILNFDLLDPSDSMENFVHNMKFYKTKGFAPVEKLSADDFRHVHRQDGKGAQ